MIDAARWITEYGYVAVVIGSIIEGETIAFLAGAAAHKHLLFYPWVVLLTILGAILGDTTLYFVGRHFGTPILRRFPGQQAKISYVQAKIRRNESWLILGMRFAYGFRTIGPIIIGSSGVRPAKFILFNVLGAILWALVIVTLGYGASELLLRLFADPHQRLWAGGALLLGLALALLLLRWYKRRRRDAQQ
ncbi:DedA family protein [Edwardsiella tarda]|uniref:DedA family protein n=1 Tax=Edwardsiella tarda TaxID=636 RepID=UPI000318B8C1|nr:DedA family protein [Edwardsiella tarda]